MQLLKLFFVLILSITTVNTFGKDKKNISIELLPASEKQIDNLTATAFGVSLAGWVSSNQEIDNVSTGAYQPSFEALKGVFASQITIWRELKAKDSTLQSDYMNDLLLVDDAGYLNEYIWINHIKADSKSSMPADLNVDKFQHWSKQHLKSHQPRMEATLTIQ